MYARRKVFVSYHHGRDREYYNEFVRLFSQSYQVVADHSVRQEIQSDNADYVIRRIREEYLTGASATVVLVGPETWGRRFVDWEILASLNQGMGLIGINLPTSAKDANGNVRVPDRFLDNYHSGYALWVQWSALVASPSILSATIERSLTASKNLIVNSRAKRLRSA